MNLKSFLYFIGVLSLLSCNQKSSDKNESRINSPLAFINSYVEDCNKMKLASNINDWVNSSELVTQNFKGKLKSIIDEANEKDPELGLGADPIFDAQDYPDKGFELESFDEKSNYIIVKGRNWPEFRLTIKVVKENNKWLVDGCGMINIPTEKRMKR